MRFEIIILVKISRLTIITLKTCYFYGRKVLPSRRELQFTSKFYWRLNFIGGSLAIFVWAPHFGQLKNFRFSNELPIFIM